MLVLRIDLDVGYVDNGAIQDRPGGPQGPAGARREAFMVGQSVLPAVALIAVGALPMFLDAAGGAYLIGASLLGAGFTWCAAQLALSRSAAVARRLLFASIVYLPALLVLLLVGRGARR